MSKKHGRENDSVVVDTKAEKSEVAVREEAIQQFWDEHDIFNKSLQRPSGAEPVGEYVFYDGPPFATGLPHYGHLLAGTIKDAVPRFWTMRGYRVRRKWGWDCHGLPLENLIEKELGLASKRDIEEFGIQNFNEKARGAVMRYADEWRQIIPRFGRFVDMDDDYKTMDSSYTESVWWVFKTLHEKNLVFEGFKGMHLCPRCGTTLSNFEVNLGYKDIKDIAVTVKLPLLDEHGVITDTSLLVWTTTPWTLPGNLAAAVHQDYTYIKVQLTEIETEEYVILAKERLEQLGDIAYEVVSELSGSELVGQKYEPPFPYLQPQVTEGRDKAWTIYHADYVELGTEGTGAVHLAPAYGEEDMELAKTHGIPIVHHVDYEGRFMDFVTDFAGQKVKPKDDDNAGVMHLDADIEIVKALKDSGRLIKKENITHSYPHCWRDDTPLLNYATTSWFVDVPKIRDELVVANQQVHWVPEHIGSNRFGKWLEGARDWAVSRQRYWGAPLPIWRNTNTGDYKVFGSLSELQSYVPRSGNTYIVMRHAEAQSNLDAVINADPAVVNPLTTKGQQQVREAVKSLKEHGITRIVHSQLQRARETAEVVAKELGLSAEAVTQDVRLNELQAGTELEGGPWSAYQDLFGDQFLDQYQKEIPGIENRQQLQARLGSFLFEIEQTYKDETILIVSHAGSIFALECAARGDTAEQAAAKRKGAYFQNAEVRELSFVPYPHNDHYQLDFHRPYIDRLKLIDTDGSTLERIPDVFDCWFESGAMPYAETHYPFANLDVADPASGVRFPANFIAESVDQTRGWFYSLMVLGVALFGKSPYQNVITNGLVLAEDGKKMSKSLQNYPDPMELVDRVGADAVRYYLLSSPIIRGEDLNFSEKEVTEQMRKNIGRLHNVLAMYELYADGTAADRESEHVLDRWIIARLDELLIESTTGYTNYELDKATRPLMDFIDDLSVWYVRRSRDRLKGDDIKDKVQALATLRYILRELAKVMAPPMPFYAEYLFQAVRDEEEAESVHLTAWPEAQTPDQGLLVGMAEVRRVVSEALEQRAKAGIKVRQPLASLSFSSDVPSMGSDLFFLIQEEVNVKKVEKITATNSSSVALNTDITPELKAEGTVRELIRAIQQSRKERGLDPHQRIRLQLDDVTMATLEPMRDEVLRVTGSTEMIATPLESNHYVVTVDGVEYRYDILVL